MKLETYLDLRMGGRCDGMAWSSLAASALYTSPFFGSDELALLSKALGFGGSAFLTNRVLKTLGELPFLKSSTGIQSSDLQILVEDLKRVDGFIIGYTTDTGEPLVLSYDDAVRHIDVLGQSGSGKSVLLKFFQMQQILRGGGLMFIDAKMKGEDLDEIWRMCQWAGRGHDMLVINPGDPSRSNTYAPFLYGDADEVASRGLSLIPASSDNAGADHYRQSANEGLQVIVGAIQATGLKYSFMDIVILLRSAKALEELEQLLMIKAPNSPNLLELRLFLDRYREVDPKTKIYGINVNKMKDIFGGISGRLYSFAVGNFGKIMNTYMPEVNLYEAILTNKIIYVMLPTMGKKEQALNFAKMLMGDFRTALSWLQKLPESELPRYPFLVQPDEAGSYVSDPWSEIFQQGRSAKIIMMPAAQTKANYEAISNELKEMITGNTLTKIIFKIGTHDTASQVAELLGVHQRLVRSLSIGGSDSKSHSDSASSPQGSGGDSSSVNIGERSEEAFRVHADQLKKLDIGEAVVFCGGEHIYNVRVPRFTIDKKTIKAMGKTQINHFRQPFARGLDLAKNIDKYLTSADMKQLNRQAA